LCVALGTFLRVHAAFASGLFDGPPEGLLRADPGTLWYLLQRVIAGGGWPDASFAADPRIEHPDLVDCWATFTVGHEFLLAGLHRAFPDVPLHRLCTVALALCMSLCAVGIYALAAELSGKVAPAVIATALFTLTPGAYRTIGFVLMNEDTSLPLYTAHLALAARALRVRTVAAAAWAAGAGVLAAATWHATTFLLVVQLACVLAWAAWSGRSLLPPRAALAFVATLSLASLLVPALRAKGFAFGLPVQLSLAIAAGAWLRARRPSLTPTTRLLIGAGAAIVLAGAGLLCSRALHVADGDFSHVFALLLAKLRHVGVYPQDPAVLSFDARIMWQGPFATLAPSRMVEELGFAHVPALLTLVLALHRTSPAVPRHPAAGVLPLFVVISLLLATLIMRLLVLPAVLLPITIAWLSPLLPRKTFLAGALCVLAGQALVAHHFFSTLVLDWHGRMQREEARAAVEAIRDFTPQDAAIAADPVLSGAILAHTGRHVALQAKWESTTTRTRLRTLIEPFHLGTVADVHRTLTQDLRCDYFLVDRAMLWGNMRQLSGIPQAQELPAPGTAAAAFCSNDLRELSRLPGFKLLYRTPSWIRYDNGEPSENVRLFQVLR
jgi:hypothetical protein